MLRSRLNRLTILISQITKTKHLNIIRLNVSNLTIAIITRAIVRTLPTTPRDVTRVLHISKEGETATNHLNLLLDPLDMLRITP